MSDTDRDKLVSIILKNLHTNSSRIADAILAEFLPEHDRKKAEEVFDEGAWAAHDRLHGFVHEGLIDQHMLLRPPVNPYREQGTDE